MNLFIAGGCFVCMVALFIKGDVFWGVFNAIAFAGNLYAGINY